MAIKRHNNFSSFK